MRSVMDSERFRSSFRSCSSMVIMGALVGAVALPSLAAAAPAGNGPSDPKAAAVRSTDASTPSEAPAEAAAQDSATDAVLSFFRKVEFSGLLDTYFTYNFNEPTTGASTPLRNFDVRHNQFSLALVEFAMSKPAVEDDRVGFRFDLQYGQVAKIFNADLGDSDPFLGDSLINVQQGYVSYLAPVGSGLTFEVGKFVTPIGTEPTESNLNNNYSRAFLYALGPYYHAGARVAYNVNDKFALGAMLVNGWNATGDNNSGKSFGVTATVKPVEKLTVVQNFLVGPEQTDNADDIRMMSDTNVAVTVTDKVSAGLNYVYVKDEIAGEGISWQGVAFYFRGQITPKFAVAPRIEWYDDTDGFITGTAQALKEFTLTGEIKHSQGLLFRAEYRRDWSDADFFVKNDRPVDNQNTFTMAFVYSFSSKAP